MKSGNDIDQYHGKEFFEPYENSNRKTFDPDEEPAYQSPIEQVALTVPTTDDPTILVYTFRMWVIGLLSCTLLAFLNQFFCFRTEPLFVIPVAAQIAALSLGRLMAATLPARTWFKGSWAEFSLNPGPFNMKEHVLITLFANAGGWGVYAVSIVTTVKAFYGKHLSFLASLSITFTTQMLGYGWAGLFKNFLVKPSQMWWPYNLVNVSLFRMLHEPDVKPKGGFTRQQFFVFVLFVSFAWYILPGYWFPMLSSFSWVCSAWPKSITAQQLGSGLYGLGIGAVTLDWATVSSFLGSPLATPFFAIVNLFIGFFVVMYVVTPLTYFNDVYQAKTFPIFSSNLFDNSGQIYNISRIINDQFSIDMNAYNQYSKLHLSTFFVFNNGVQFATLAALWTHVFLFHGKDVWNQMRSAMNHERQDVHTRLMKAYPEVPQWWFHTLLVVMIAISMCAAEYFKEQLQLPWWGVILACAFSASFIIPIGILTATTNYNPGLNVMAEYLIGYVYPGRPVANACFKVYSTMSMAQAVYFMGDLKLGHDMKIPPRSMFSVQIVGTLVGSLVSLTTAWWLLTTVKNICHKDLLPTNSSWTCPGDRVFYDNSVIWGLIGPKRIFGSEGLYANVNWCFAFGAVAPIPVWLASRRWPEKKWIRLINMPIIIGATAGMPPAAAINQISYFVVGVIFNYFVFKYRKGWWQRYNYLTSAALDSGLAFMGIALYLTLGMDNKSITWWGSDLDSCPLASCPTAPGIKVSGC